MRTMKSLFIIFAVAAALALPQPGRAADLGEFRLSHLEGDVQINNEETGEWVPASANMPLRSGDRLWVPSGGRAEIQSRSGTIVRLDRNTSADVLRVEDHSSQLNINSGAAYINFSGSDDLIQVDTPLASIRTNNKSKLNVEVAENGDANILVFTGKAAIEDRAGIIDVKSGDALVLKRDQEARLYNLPAADEWDRWNISRDRIYSDDSRGSRYLPQELKSYSRDLDNNGSWVEVRDYGWVWAPRTDVAVDWAPYRTGRWVWIGGDYVWVSYEPWGWAPYHYGRWAYSPGVGWCWVPPRRGFVYWGPGYVGWVRTSTYVSWVPLAPGEIYYGHGYYGPQSVNITSVNININKTVVNVYKNVNVNNSVTVVNHQSFVSGNYKREKFDRTRYLNERISVVGPNLPPTRASRIPVIKEIRSDKMPPGRISHINIERVREDRKLVKDQNISVMRPGARQEQRRVEPASRPMDRQDVKSGRRSDEQNIKRGQLPNRDNRTDVPQRSNSDRLEKRGGPSYSPAPADRNRELRPDAGRPHDAGVQPGKKPEERVAPVKSREEKAQPEPRANVRERKPSQDRNHPVQQKDKAVPDKHRIPQTSHEKKDRPEKEAKPGKEVKPGKDVKKEHRDNIKDEGEGHPAK